MQVEMIYKLVTKADGMGEACPRCRHEEATVCGTMKNNNKTI
jgi:hypothetical protein